MIDGDDASVASHDVRELEGGEAWAAADIENRVARREASAPPRQRGIGAPHTVLKSQSFDLGVVRAEYIVVLGRCRHTGTLHVRTADAVRFLRPNSVCQLSASRSRTVPSRTMVVSQLKANRSASAHVVPNASPGAHPSPCSARSVANALASATSSRS